MLNVAVVGYVLEQLQGKPPVTGCLITLDGECHRVNFRPMYKAVSSILERIERWSAEPPRQPPPVILNKHCPYCPYKNACRQQAEEADDLSLLDRTTPKVIRRYHNRGIFTVKQLSFLFKPRRRKRRRVVRPPVHSRQASFPLAVAHPVAQVRTERHTAA
jgi:predicted RecB family nuclease